MRYNFHSTAVGPMTHLQFYGAYVLGDIYDEVTKPIRLTVTVSLAATTHPDVLLSCQ